MRDRDLERLINRWAQGVVSGFRKLDRKTRDDILAELQNQSRDLADAIDRHQARSR